MTLNIKDKHLNSIREREIPHLEKNLTLGGIITAGVVGGDEVGVKALIGGLVTFLGYVAAKRRVKEFGDRKYHAFRHETLTDLVEDKPISKQTPFWEKSDFIVLPKTQRVAFSFDVIDAYLEQGDLVSADKVYDVLNKKDQSKTDYVNRVHNQAIKMDPLAVIQQLEPIRERLSSTAINVLDFAYTRYKRAKLEKE